MDTTLNLFQKVCLCARLCGAKETRCVFHLILHSLVSASRVSLLSHAWEKRVWDSPSVRSTPWQITAKSKLQGNWLVHTASTQQVRTQTNNQQGVWQANGCHTQCREVALQLIDKKSKRKHGLWWNNNADSPQSSSTWRIWPWTLNCILQPPRRPARCLCTGSFLLCPFHTQSWKTQKLCQM